MNRLEQAFISDRDNIELVDFLASELPFSKSRLKKVIHAGGVWIKRPNQEPFRCHQHGTQVRTGDEIHIYHDPELLAIRSPLLTLVEDHKAYSVWKKPPGISDEVSLYSDHLTLERVIQQSLPASLDCYLFDPVPSSITGLCLIAHTNNIAAKINSMLNSGDIKKDYHLVLAGEIPSNLEQITLSDKHHINCKVLPSKDYKPVTHLVLEQAQQKEELCIEALASLGFHLHENGSLHCVHLSFTCPIENTQQDISLIKR